MRRLYFGHFIVCCLSLITFKAMADEALTCAPSEQLSVEYNYCRHESHKPIYKAETSQLCDSLPLCPNNTLTDDETCRITTNALVSDKICGVKEYNTCEHIQSYEVSEPRTCTSKWYDGVGGDNSCKDLWSGSSDRCSKQWILKHLPKDSILQNVSATRTWKDNKLITGHRIKASHQCKFTYDINKPIKVTRPAAACGVKEFHKCWRPGYSQCRRKEFGLQWYSSQQSKVCGVKSIAPINEQPISSDKRCLKCDHLPKDSFERFQCLRENRKLGVGISGDMMEKLHSEILTFLTTKFRKGETVSADKEDIVQTLSKISDKEYDRIVWSFFIGEKTGEDSIYWASIYLDEEVRSKHATNWVFLSKMQLALKDFNYLGADYTARDLHYLLYDYFVRAYVSELEQLRGERFKVIELKKAIEGKGNPNTSGILSQAQSLGLSDELIALLKSKLSINSTGIDRSTLIAILSDLSENLKREADQVHDKIKDSISQFGELNERATFFNVYLDVANLNIRSALIEVRKLSHTLAYEYEWGTGYAVRDNMKVSVERKAKATSLLLEKLSQENVSCKGYSDDLEDLDPALAAVLMQAKMSMDQGAHSSGCEGEIQTAKELLYKHYLMPLLELRAEFESKE